MRISTVGGDLRLEVDDVGWLATHQWILAQCGHLTLTRFQLGLAQKVRPHPSQRFGWVYSPVRLLDAVTVSAIGGSFLGECPIPSRYG